MGKGSLVTEQIFRRGSGICRSRLSIFKVSSTECIVLSDLAKIFLKRVVLKILKPENAWHFAHHPTLNSNKPWNLRRVTSVASILNFTIIKHKSSVWAVFSTS